MTTKGLARQSGKGVGGLLLELPGKIAAAEARGHPVVVEAEPGQLNISTQRLYATLGCLVRFVERTPHA